MPSVPFTLLQQPELSDNIKKENISDQHIYITGNTVIDALLWMKNRLSNRPFKSVYESANFLFEEEHLDKKVILITGHRRESLGDGFCESVTAIQQLAERKSRRSFGLSRTSQSKCTKASVRFAV